MQAPSQIELETAKVLGVIRAKPHDYQDALELSRNKQVLLDDIMSYLGMYLQGILVINASFYKVTSNTMFEYEKICAEIRKQNLASARPIPQNVRLQFQQWLKTDLPLEWLHSFMREYRLHLYGTDMWVDIKKREYISEFNDPRFLRKTRGIWNLDYKPLKEYKNYGKIIDTLNNIP